MRAKPAGYDPRLWRARLLLLVGCAAAHVPAARSQPYQLRAYSVDEGLAQSQVVALSQDRKGFLWLGTYGGGASRFDGKNFKNLTRRDGLASNVVRVIVQDSRGDTWFGTEEGLSKYDGTSFVSLTSRDGLPGNRVRSLCVSSRGDLLIGTDTGACRYDGRKFTPLPTGEEQASSRIGAILEDRRGNIWLATRGGGVTVLSSSTLRPVGEGLPSPFMLALLEDREGRIWVAGLGGARRFDGSRFIVPPGIEALEGTTVYSICQDRHGVVWLGTDHGLARYDGARLQLWTAKQGLSRDLVLSMLEDREGNLWFGTDGGGVCRLGSEAFVRYGAAEGLASDVVLSFCRDKKGSLWVGTAEGTSRLDAGGGFRTEERLGHGPVWAILRDSRGNMWFGGGARGVTRWDGSAYRAFSPQDGLPDTNISAMVEDARGRVWFASPQGASCYDGRTFERFTSSEMHGGGEILDVHRDRGGRLWFATSGGIVEYDGTSFARPPGGEVLRNMRVETIAEDAQGRLWFGTYGWGVMCYGDPHDVGRVADWVTTRDGLADDTILFLLFDDQEGLWIGTNRGLDRLDVAVYRKTGKKALRHYGSAEGFSGVECTQNAAFKDEDGSLWFGTIKGAVRYDRSLDERNLVEAITQITGVRLVLQTVDWRAEGYRVDGVSGLPADLRLPHYRNHVTFDFIGISLSIPEKVRYRYRLEGFDSAWSPPIGETSATYSSLPPGDYAFQVTACNNDGVWNARPVSYAFTISAPFWRRGWFLGLVVLLAAALVYTLGKERQALRTRREKLRTEMARSLAIGLLHELRQPLQILQTQLDILARRAPAQDAVGTVASALNALTRLRRLLERLESLQRGDTLRTKPYAKSDEMVDLGVEDKK